MREPFFCEKHFIDYSMVDNAYNLKLSALLRLMQNAATAHYDSLGLGRMKLIKDGVVFLLSKIALKINRMPKADETLNLTTWEYGVKGAYFVRNFNFAVGEEKDAVVAQTLWVSANPNTHAIVRPSDFPYPINENPTEVDVTAGKVTERGMDEVYKTKRAVRFSDLDCNGHMNNAVYADICADVLFECLGEVSVREFSVNYNRESKVGDTLTLTLFKGEDNTFVVSGDFSDGTNSFKAKIL